MLRSTVMCTGLLGLAAVIHGAPAAAQTVSQPAASIHLTQSRAGPYRWFGAGEIHVRTTACIASTTGRYRLTLRPATADALGFEVEFVTDEGDAAERHAPAGQPIQFEGRTRFRDDCRGASNATISIRFPKDTLSAALAGEYAKRIEFSVEPA